MKRINRSKYNFSKLAMGESFPIDGIDLVSMKNSLRFYNGKHSDNIVVECSEPDDNGKVTVTRVPVKVGK